MPSGASHESYRSDLSKSLGFASDDATVRRRAASERTERLTHLRGTVGEREVHEVRDTRELIDPRLAKMEVTKPDKKATGVTVVLVDNSGSNATVARKVKQGTGYLTAGLNVLAPTGQIVLCFFSDHCDGPNCIRPIDFVFPDEKGDKILASSIDRIHGAHGGDEPEAIECAFHWAAGLNFGHVPKEQRHLILVSDVVAHGMGYSGTDTGCPEQRSWKKALQEVHETFGTFTVVGTGRDPEMCQLQRQFIAKDRIGLDLIDLSSIKNEELRLGMVSNAVLFLCARQTGKQGVRLFLAGLYEKWLKEPIFGEETDEQAKAMIRRLAQFLDWPKAEIDQLVKDVLAE